MTSRSRPTKPQQRQIRALYDKDTVTVYQAYCEEIANPAVAEQRLSASPRFSGTRMTWIKPSWCWMMYRAGYSYKDPRQARILALKMKHEHFQRLLSQAAVIEGQKGGLTAEERAKTVRVQWDPERSPRIGMLDYRRSQIGISGKVSSEWANEWIVEIEDVTEKAKALKKTIDEDAEIELGELIRKGLVPEERVYEIPEELRRVLQMNRDS